MELGSQIKKLDIVQTLKMSCLKVFDSPRLAPYLKWSTMLPNCSPPASTFARSHGVGGKQAAGTIYAKISSHNIPRISFAFRPRAPNPYRSVLDVDCRRPWRTSIKATIEPSRVRGGGRGSVNMWPPCIPSRP